MLSTFYLLISDSLSVPIKGWFTGIDRGVHIVTSIENLVQGETDDNVIQLH